MGELYQIQKDAQSIAEVIAAALNVETEIIDDTCKIMGATGRVRGFLLTKRTDSFITQWVIKHNRPFVITNPGKNKLCQPCPEKDECIFTGGIYYPIDVNEKCHGVISLVSFNEHQKNLLVANQNSFIDFVAKMADLLATKLQQVMTMNELSRANEYLEAIINSVNEGIISCDENGLITCFNQTAERVFGLSKHEAIGHNISTVLPNSLLNKALLECKSFYDEKIPCTHTNGDGINLISNATIVTSNKKILGAVESFSEEEKIFRVAYRLSNREDVTAFDNIIGTSAIIKKTKRLALEVAQSASTILITGESGTGKELFARAVHSASHRSKEPFVAINCSAIPDSLLESELFGYERGAFTGAKNEGKLGKFELAHGGTIFLDEIGDMPLHLQIKILRVLQEKNIEKVGGTKNIPVDVRIIAATHQNLTEQIAKKQFREDLYYRLNVIPLTIPPLRERSEDIPVLIEYLCQKYASILNKNIQGLSKGALNILLKYKWPGNVRELENAIEYAINFCPNGSHITKDTLPSWLFNTVDIISAYGENMKQKLEMSEKQILLEALDHMGSSLQAKKQIAQNMGISLSSLYRKLRKYHLIAD
ncbi:sigma-54 interaction domain-containing protein [Candidatus Formimonas warabiya]|uniref:Uncharacterized protein n=1 Tax=Formimonas warabiya TaxID=1761012 RepID=A0A3G1KV08_FORW1|nr:sigma 54-interacting transcriptional regulator [Candidatus Formimonas warabiya]ATW26289.1 hypothetical protein DCMF_17340 [Candidatus Formimonas warabiya]